MTIKVQRTVLFLALAASLSVFADEVRTNAPADQLVPASKGTRIWISSFSDGSSPTKITTEEREWHFANGKCTPPIPLEFCRQWRTNYISFRQLLISESDKAHLNSGALAKVLPELDAQKSNTFAILPVEVQSAEVKGELRWVVTYRWENVEHGAEGINHMLTEEFSQKTLKLVWAMRSD